MLSEGGLVSQHARAPHPHTRFFVTEHCIACPSRNAIKSCRLEGGGSKQVKGNIASNRAMWTDRLGELQQMQNPVPGKKSPG